MVAQLLRGSLHAAGRALALRSLRRQCAQHASPSAARLHPGRAAASAAAAPQAPAAPEAGSSPAADDGPAFRANIDFKFVRDNVEAVAHNCRQRLAAADPHEVARLYEHFGALQRETDAVRAARNDNSAAMKGKLEADARVALIDRGRALKEQLEGLEAALAGVEAALQREGQRLPNMTHPDVPHGGEEAAVLLREVGAPRDFGFAPRDHLSLGESLDLLDFETAAAVSGAKFYYLRREAALLELALVQYAMHKVVRRGFVPMMTPDLVRESVFEKCGFQPRADNTQIYGVRDSPLCLTGTAEIPLGGAYMDKVVPEAELPLKMAAFGHCFRTEAGAAGAAGRGLYRVHQFSKVEMFVVCTPEQSDALHEELIALEVEMFTELGLHFKVLDMPTHDLGAPAYRKYDVEAWMPGLGRYGEISSASNCTDYQARRLNIRYKPATAPGGEAGKKGGKKGGATAFAHTLNATACAVPRMIVAILENFQQEDGSVVVPEALRPYMMGIEVIRR
jgi:seryl-tRNA synthetase